MKLFSKTEWALLLTSMLITVLLLSGCTQADVDRAKVLQAHAEARLVQAHEAAEVARVALEQMKAIALAVGGTQAEALVKKGELAAEATHDAETVAAAVVDATGKAVADAERSQAAGQSTLNTILTIVGSLATGAGGIAGIAIPIIAKYRRAITVTAAHADRMENAETQGDVDIAKQVSIAEQAAAGVTAIIEKARA